MFYMKSVLAGGMVKAEITDKNVFTKCPECGRELSVDIAEILSGGEGDLFSTSVICSRCTAWEMAKRAKASDITNVPITYDGLVWLDHILTNSGYDEEITGLFDMFLIEDLADLRPEEYTAFGNALAQLVIEMAED